jgi:hypothetical protein
MTGGDGQVRSFDQTAPLLNAIGMAAAKEEPLDKAALCRELEMEAQTLEMLLGELERVGLAWFEIDEDGKEVSPFLSTAGTQYLAMKGEVPAEILHFLPRTIDDLHARKALIVGGGVLVDEFRYALLHGNGVDYAARLVPDAFAGAVDEGLALNLFAAAVALMARLSSDAPAACLAEEIIAVALLNEATVWIDMQSEEESLEYEDAESATAQLQNIYDLFGDSDVLYLFEMEEPADAALAGHSTINRIAGIADQRLEAWFEPFWTTAATGYLDERKKSPAADDPPDH